MPTGPKLVNILTRAHRQSPGANDQTCFIVEESVAGTQEYPIAENIAPISDDVQFEQVPDQVDDPRRTSSSRAPIGKITGAYPEGKATLKVPFAPTTTLGGTDVPYGWEGVRAFFGSAINYVRGQAGVAIGALQSYSRDYMVIRLAGATTDYNLMDCLALRIGAAAGTEGEPGNGEHTYVVNIADAGGGNLDLNLEPPFSVRPTTSDYLRGGVSAKPDEDWMARFSVLGLDGFKGIHAWNGVVDTLSVDYDRQKIAEWVFGYLFATHSRVAEDHIWGDTTTDFFQAVDTVLRVTDARKFLVGNNRTGRAILRLMTCATGLQSGADEVVNVTNADETNNTVTLERALLGTSALAVITGTNGRLRAVTAAGQEKNGNYAIVAATNDILTLNIDNRGDIEITLTPGAARTPAQVIADINAALAADERYGLYTEALTGRTIDWSGAAGSDGGTAVRLTSQVTGSASRVACITSDSADASTTIFDAAFDLTAPNEVQILPWNPDDDGLEAAAALALVPKHGRFGFSKIGHAILEEAGTMTVASSNKAEALKDIRISDPTGIAGFVPGIYREPTISVTVDARGWTDALDAIADSNTRVPFLYQVGGDVLGSGFSIFCRYATIGQVTRSNSGARRQVKFTVTPLRGSALPEMAAGIA